MSRSTQPKGLSLGRQESHHKEQRIKCYWKNKNLKFWVDFDEFSSKTWFFQMKENFLNEISKKQRKLRIFWIFCSNHVSFFFIFSAFFFLFLDHVKFSLWWVSDVLIKAFSLGSSWKRGNRDERFTIF